MLRRSSLDLTPAVKQRQRLAENAASVALPEQPEVILIDIGLPQLNGYEVATLLRATPDFQNALFIAMTGYTDTPNRGQGENGGGSTR